MATLIHTQADPAIMATARAIKASRDAAEAGCRAAARLHWLVAARLVLRCGGVAGNGWAGAGYAAIVFPSGAVYTSPVPLQ